MKVLVVVDMQNDFVTGALGTKEAEAIVPYVVGRVVEAKSRRERLFFTRDTHEADYLQTQEGRKLPVEHCIRGSAGWQIVAPLTEYTLDETAIVLDKPTFGSTELGDRLWRLNEQEPIEAVTLIGLCTDICVISNALLVKACLPEVPVRVEAACCAGVTPESHRRALGAMSSCQVEIVE